MEARTQGLGTMQPPPVSAPPAQFDGSSPAPLPEARLIAVLVCFSSIAAEPGGSLGVLEMM